VTFLKEKNDSGLEWQRAGHSLPAAEPAGQAQPRFYISTVVVQRTLLFRPLESNDERSFSSAASSSGNKSGHLKKGG